MPQDTWSPKRERQYEHIKEGMLERGNDEEKAEEIAARTVNKERAQRGETKETSRTSIEDLSPGRRGGLRSRRGSGGQTYDQLRNEAKQRVIRGRSKMTKAQLESVLSR
jgi:plasmid stabilization system protein ParE